jgi:hypothetical protein
MLSLMALFVAGGALYLGLTNDIAATGYEISHLEQSVDEKRMEVQKLEATTAEIRSSQVSVVNPNDVSFVTVDRIEYLAAMPLSGVAVK